MRIGSSGSWGAIAALVLALTTATTLHAGEPSASDRETARGLLEQGDAAMTAGDARGALKFYEGAHALLNLPATGMAVVRAHVALHELVEARDVALSVLKIPEAPNEKQVHVEARKEADKTANELATRIPSLTLEIVTDAGDLAVEIDGGPIPRAVFAVPRKLNPGPHVVRATAAGMRPFESTVDLAEGEQKRVSVGLTPIPVEVPPPKKDVPQPPKGDEPKPSRGLSALVPVGFSIAGAGLVTGAIAGGISIAQVSDAKAAHGCGETCPSSERESLEADLDASRTTAWVSNVGFIVAGAGAILGTVGIVVSVTGRADASPSPAVSLGFDGSRLVLGGTF